MDPVKKCEELYPQTCEEFKKIQQEHYELFCEKQLDYGPSNIMMGGNLEKEEDVKVSIIGLITRIGDKANRLIHLGIKTSQAPNNESIIDSFKDMSNYCVISQLIKRGKWGK